MDTLVRSVKVSQPSQTEPECPKRYRFVVEVHIQVQVQVVKAVEGLGSREGRHYRELLSTFTAHLLLSLSTQVIM